jgi:adenylate kinase
MEKNKVAIIMLGAPGSGKGTQGEILEKNTGFKRYVMSDLIKLELKPGNEIYENVFKKGELLKDCDIFSIFRKYFKGESEIIIDGIPRTLDQAYWLYGFLKSYNYNFKLIFLNVNENKLIKRITSRYYCPKCHRLYNLEFKKPKKEGICDVCGVKLIQREDDKPEVFKERIKIWDNVKEAILKVYNGEIIEINGDQSIENVSKEIMKNIILKN